MKLSVVICGWYFKNTDIYKTLIQEAKLYKGIEASYFIASHRRYEELDRALIRNLEKLGWRLIFFENEGWDWGAYQQFLIWHKKEKGISDYYLFMHDDVKIKNYGFIKEFMKKIQNGAKVVGNGLKRNPKTSRKLTYPEIIYWSEINGFPIKSKKWKCVRGSCFFTIREIAENILVKMPIKKGHHVGFGNWSTIIFGGLITDMYGEKSVNYIGSKETESYYINEAYRGGKSRFSLKGLICTIMRIFSIPSKRFNNRQESPSSITGLR